ncbi:hypothetical protein GCM10017673_21320 [Streptosporangium violaceochromogenes]|nr:hypothetical protein GCM10017673_21320 [Streptosporangium violaceochromogenes]
MVPFQLRLGGVVAVFDGLDSATNPNSGTQYCGYAFYSDADAVSVGCAVNTRAHLARAQAADPEYYRWTPAEWALEGFGHEHFTDLNRRLLDLSSAARRSELAGRRDGAFEAAWRRWRRSSPRTSSRRHRTQS